MLNAFARCPCTESFAGAVGSFAAESKGDLEDLIIRRSLRVAPRVGEMMENNRRCRVKFYRETLYGGSIYPCRECGGSFLGSAGVKQFRCIAEKAGRFPMARLFREVKSKADMRAGMRAVCGIDTIVCVV